MRSRWRGSASAEAGGGRGAGAQAGGQRVGAAGFGGRLGGGASAAGSAAGSTGSAAFGSGRCVSASSQAEDGAQARGGAAEGGVDGVVGAGAARADGLAGVLGQGTGLGVEDGLGQRAGGVAAAAHLVGDEGGGPPVAGAHGHLEHAPGHPLELAQALLGRQGLHLGQGGEQFLEVGLGEELVDLGRGDVLGPGEVGARHAGGEAVGGAQLAARGGQRRATRGGPAGGHGDDI